MPTEKNPPVHNTFRNLSRSCFTTSLFRRESNSSLRGCLLNGFRRPMHYGALLGGQAVMKKEEGCFQGGRFSGEQFIPLRTLSDYCFIKGKNWATCRIWAVRARGDSTNLPKFGKRQSARPKLGALAAVALRKELPKKKNERIILSSLFLPASSPSPSFSHPILLGRW